MARVAGVDLPREKRGEVAVTYIYGLGRSTGRRILLRANVDPSKRVKAWSDDEVNRIREAGLVSGKIADSVSAARPKPVMRLSLNAAISASVSGFA